MQLINYRLDLFDGAAAAAAPAGGASGGAQAAPADTGTGKSGGKQTVVYGKQPEGTAGGPDAGGQGVGSAGVVASNAEEALAQEYDDLMNGKFKDLHAKREQELFNRRFKDFKGDREALDAQSPIVDTLKQRYGVDSVDDLQKAIEADDSFWEQAAEDAGMSVQQFREYQRMERENAQFRAAQEAAQSQAQADQQVQKWYTEAQALKQQPGFETFDLQGEADNPEFVRLLQSGIPVQHAYEVIHMDDIIAAQAQQTSKAVVDNIRARGTRPAENGTASSNAVTYKADVHKLTAEDRREIARRTRMGEHITF